MPPLGVGHSPRGAVSQRTLAVLLLLSVACAAENVSSYSTALRGVALEHTVRRWRDAEYALQASERSVRLLDEALAAKAITDEASLDKLAWSAPTPEAQLAAERNSTRDAVAALKANLPRLRAAVDAVWPPVSTSALLDDELPPQEVGCSAARLRHGARPHPTSPLPPNAFTRRYNVSFLVRGQKAM